MIIYGSTLSPFVRKTVAFANEKGLSFELKQIGIGSENADFLASSPMRKIPSLKDGDFAISDSSAIVHYLDAKFPAHRLIPESPQDLARAVWFDEFADTVLVAAMGKIFFNRIVSPRFLGKPGSEEAALEGIAELPRLFDYLESAAPNPGGYLVGGALTLADLAVASPFVNLAHCGIDVDKSRHPRLAAYIASVLGRASFAPMVAGEKALLAA